MLSTMPRRLWRSTVLIARSVGKGTPRGKIWQPSIWRTLTRFLNSVLKNKSFSLPQRVMGTKGRVLSPLSPCNQSRKVLRRRANLVDTYSSSMFRYFPQEVLPRDRCQFPFSPPYLTSSYSWEMTLNVLTVLQSDVR